MNKKVYIEKKMAPKTVNEHESTVSSTILEIWSKIFTKYKQSQTEKTKKQYELYELYKNLNPRYFEKGITLKDAKMKIYSSDLNIYSYL